MLTQLTGRPRPLKAYTWDLEWWPHNLELRVAGFFDGRNYHAFLNMYSFCKYVFRRQFSGGFFFAHFGGRFDEVYLLREIASNPLLDIDMAFSGSSIVRLRVQDKAGYHWTFVDSQFLFKEPLKLMGKSVGLLKPDCPFDAPLPQLKERNEADCRILYMAIDRAARAMADLGSGLSYTIASTAMQLFRRKYLDRDIPTSTVLNSEVRPGYVASRVENISIHSPQGSHYDVNGLFPFAMLRPLPGQHLRTDRTIGDCSIVKGKVTVPPMHLPTLPVRLGNSIYFPHGTFEGVFTSQDIALLERHGGTVETVDRVYHFEPFDAFASYVRDMYRFREENKQLLPSGQVIVLDEFLDLYWKKMQNALYGKTSERGDKERIVFRPAEMSCPHEGKPHNDESGRNPSCMRHITSDIWAVRDPGEPAHTHVPIAMGITSLGRSILHDYINNVPNLAAHDTDGFWGECSFRSSKALGDVKHVYNYRNGTFFRPKLYAVDLDEPWATQAVEEAKKEGEVDAELEERLRHPVKAKGFPKLNRLQFEGLTKGLEVDTRIFFGPRTTMHDGFQPKEEMRKKHLYRVCPTCETPTEESSCYEHPEAGLVASHRLPPKRIYHASGGSDPWEYTALKDEYEARK